MEIERLTDTEKYPCCPDCNVPLWIEGQMYSAKQEADMKKEAECDHVYSTVSSIPLSTCVKCTYTTFTMRLMASTKMRCPKCASVFRVNMMVGE